MRHTDDGKSKVGERKHDEVTKTEILYYITQHPETFQADIRKYIRQELKVGSSRKSTDIPLAALVRDKIIEKTKHPKGEKCLPENSYHVINSYGAFSESYKLFVKRDLLTKKLSDKQRYLEKKSFENQYQSNKKMIKKREYLTEFMKSSYFKDYTAPDDFANIISIHICKEIVPKVFEHYDQPQHYKKLIDSSQEFINSQYGKQLVNLLNKIRKKDRSDYTAGQAINFLDHIKQSPVDEIYDSINAINEYMNQQKSEPNKLDDKYLSSIRSTAKKLLESEPHNCKINTLASRLESNKQLSEGKLFDDIINLSSSMISVYLRLIESGAEFVDIYSWAFFNLYVNVLIPPGERSQIVKLLKSSPSALDYILSLNDTDLLIFNHITMKHIVNRFEQDKLQPLSIMFNVDKKANKKKTPSKVGSKTENTVAESPITVILKSAFIQDFIKDKVIYSPDLDNMLDEIFTPKPIEAKPIEVNDQ